MLQWMEWDRAEDRLGKLKTSIPSCAMLRLKISTNMAGSTPAVVPRHPAATAQRPSSPKTPVAPCQLMKSA